MTRNQTRISGLMMLFLVAVVSCGPKQPQNVQEKRELTTAEKVRMADSYRTAGRISESLDLLAGVVLENPDNANLYGVYGEYLFLAGRYSKAEEVLERALELDPYRTDSRNWLGATLTEQQRYGEAREQYELALKDPSYPSPQLIYLNLGILLRAQGLDGDAIPRFRKAVQIDPKFFQAHYELALALETAGKIDEALDEMVVAEPAFRGEGEYWYRRGFLEFRQDRSNQAMESLRRCIDVSPGSPAAAQARELMGMIQS